MKAYITKNLTITVKGMDPMSLFGELRPSGPKEELVVASIRQTESQKYQMQ
jgi:hypothetical protein